MSAKHMEDIEALMRGLRFRKKLFGGIDEADVWRKMEMLHKEYQSAFDARRAQSLPLMGEKTPEPMTVGNVIRQRRKRLKDGSDIRGFLMRLLLLALILWVLFGVVYGIAPMKDDAMMPRISAGDLLLYYRLENELYNSDVVVFEKDDVQYTGRIVARGGDSVEITEDSELMVNGSIVIENDIYFKTPKYEDNVSYPLVLGADQVFVLCDFREGAKDSRYFGAVSLTEIKGKVITVLRRSGL